MKALPLLIILAILLHSSCNPFDNLPDEIIYPDTTVTINSLSPQVCEVKIEQSDSVYDITSYWTDKLTGRIIYKMEYNPYKYSRLHGVQLEFNDAGDTLFMAHFSEGIRVDSTVYWYPNGQVKQKYYYSKKQDGNILSELNFHPNGRRRSDVITYHNGLINGAINYYDSTAANRPTETYFYINSEIVGIKIYNDAYDELQRRKDGLLAAYQRDSARIAENFLADLEETQGTNIRVKYEGSGKEAMYDVGPPNTWDILEVDPDFILKYD